jgi:hypothetical protein
MLFLYLFAIKNNGDDGQNSHGQIHHFRVFVFVERQGVVVVLVAA